MSAKESWGDDWGEDDVVRAEASRGEDRTEGAKHTPGPWAVRDDGMDYTCPIIDSPSVGKGYYASIATATQRDPHPREGGGIPIATARANARLIAAAPDLLAALEGVMNGCVYGEISQLPGEFCWKERSAPSIAALDQARAAIAKANGEGA